MKIVIEVDDASELREVFNVIRAELGLSIEVKEKEEEEAEADLYLGNQPPCEYCDSTSIHHKKGCIQGREVDESVP